MVYNPYTGMEDDSRAAGPSVQLPTIDPSSLKNGKVPMLDDTGKPVYVPQDQLEAAVKNGFKYESPQEEARRHEAVKYDYPGTAHVAGIARGLSFGVTDLAARVLQESTGIPAADVLSKLEEYNPEASVTGEVEGTVAPAIASLGGSLLLKGAVAGGKAAAGTALKAASEKTLQHLISTSAEKAASPIANKVLAHAAAAGIEGAAVGAGQTISEQSLGTEKSAAESLMANVGLGALLGSGTSLGLSGVGMGYSKISKLISGGERAASEAAPAVTAATAEATPNVMSAAESSASAPSNPAVITKPMTMNEMIKWSDEVAPYEGITGELPVKQRIAEIRANRPEINHPLTDLHELSVESQKNLDLYRTALAMPSKEGEAALKWNGATEKEVTRRLENAANDAGPGERMLPMESGQAASDFIEKRYGDAKKAIGKQFQQLKTEEIPSSGFIQDMVNDLKTSDNRLGQSFSKMVELDGKTGKWSVRPFDSGLGITESDHAAVATFLDDAQKEGRTVKDLQNMREYLRAKIDPSDYKAWQMSSYVREKSLDYINNLIDYAKPGTNFRAISADYAKNENLLDRAERLMGGRISPADASKAIKPEKVLDRIFSSSTNINEAREVFGPEQFNKMRGDWLKSVLDKHFNTSAGELRPDGLARTLKAKEPMLRAALGNAEYQRLVDYVDTLKITKMFSNINPSGTAKTSRFMAMLGGVGEAIKEKSPAKFMHSLEDYKKAQNAIKNIASAINGNGIAAKADVEMKKSIISGIAKFVADNKGPIKQAAKYGITGAALSMSHAQYQKRADEIAALNGNPGDLAERIANGTRGMAIVHPGVHQHLVGQAAQAIKLLGDTMPKPAVGMGPMDSQKYTPSSTEISKWNRYVRAVQNPLSILDDLNNYTLTPEAVRACQMVYPETHAFMVKTALDKMASKRKPASYADKTMLSILIGQPMSYTLSPGFIQRMQTPEQPTSAASPSPHGRIPNFNKVIQNDLTGSQKVLSK